MRFTRKYTITAQDMDPDYLMTPSAILLYSQDTMAAYCSKCHIAAFDLVKDGKMWVFTDYIIKFGERRPYWLDDIEVEVWLSELSSLKMYMDFRITDHNGAEVASGYNCWTCLDMESRRPVSVLDVVDPCGMEVDSEAYRHPRAVFPQPGEQILEYFHRTNASDIDQNGHVNNRTYLSVVMSGASLQQLKALQASLVRIKFIHETFEGDTLKCIYHRVDGEHAADVVPVLAEIYDQNGTEVCKISSEWIPAVRQPSVEEHVNRK